MFNHTATFRSASSFPLTLQYLENKDVITDEVSLVFLVIVKLNEFYFRATWSP